jgi:hypothetical protein
VNGKKIVSVGYVMPNLVRLERTVFAESCKNRFPCIGLEIKPVSDRSTAIENHGLDESANPSQSIRE